MMIYLAGIFSAHNTKKEIINRMNVYLVNPATRPYCLMAINPQDVNVLESYYYLKKNEQVMPLIQKCNSFLLDSGAFTFIKNNHNKIDWDIYLGKYAEFINQYDIKLFFELDIDPIVGLEKVEQMREKLKSLTGKTPIPVWHKNRGKQYFVDMCKTYPYIALGGIALKEIPRKQFESFFPWFIATAHENNAKIHGLGYTSIDGLKKYNFDSVDSTRWLHGNVGGYLYLFEPHQMAMKQILNKGRMKSKEGAIHNFREWVKFGKYAKIYL